MQTPTLRMSGTYIPFSGSVRIVYIGYKRPTGCSGETVTTFHLYMGLLLPIRLSSAMCWAAPKAPMNCSPEANTVSLLPQFLFHKDHAAVPGHTATHTNLFPDSGMRFCQKMQTPCSHRLADTRHQIRCSTPPASWDITPTSAKHSAGTGYLATLSACAASFPGPRYPTEGYPPSHPETAQFQPHTYRLLGKLDIRPWSLRARTCILTATSIIMVRPGEICTNTSRMAAELADFVRLVRVFVVNCMRDSCPYAPPL